MKKCVMHCKIVHNAPSWPYPWTYDQGPGQRPRLGFGCSSVCKDCTRAQDGSRGCCLNGGSPQCCLCRSRTKLSGRLPPHHPRQTWSPAWPYLTNFYYPSAPHRPPSSSSWSLYMLFVIYRTLTTAENINTHSFWKKKLLEEMSQKGVVGPVGYPTISLSYFLSPITNDTLGIHLSAQ